MCTGSIGVTPNKQGYEKRVLVDKERQGEREEGVIPKSCAFVISDKQTTSSNAVLN
jgi:hypothetical protein